MKPQVSRIGARPVTTLAAAILTVALSLSACSQSQDVVFNEATTSSQAVGSATEAPEADSTETPSATSPTTSSAPPATITLSDREIDELPGRLLINGSPRQSITLLGPALEPLVIANAPGEFINQPTWSPDGQTIAWARVAENGASSVVLTDNITAVNTEYSTPFSVFYINWRPDGKVVGLLGGLNGLTTLALLDVETGTLTQLHGAVSFYFDWSPDGSKMVSHHDTQRIEVFEPETGTRTPVDTETSAFQAAVWLPDGETILYVRPTSTAQIGGLLAAQTAPVGQLVAHNLETDNISVLAEAVGLEQFSLAPDGTKVTYSAVVSATETLVQVVDLESGETQTIDGGFVYVWQWSPDSDKILLITVVDGLLQYKVWDGETVTTYATAFATGSFSGSYLPFWGQYTLSMSLWAPDSTAFVFPARHEGGDWIFLQLIDDDLPILVGPGSIAAFSPAAE